MHPDMIPWKSKAEFEQVYKGVFSADYFKTKHAVDKMDEWVQFMGESHRPGMETTRAFLQLALKDTQIFPTSDCAVEPADLQLMYSAEIMRFLNAVLEGGNKKTSLYSKARDFGIPDWLVNIRHQAAHQFRLTHISLLRRALQFILTFLQREYWEVERLGMKEMKLEDSAELLKGNVIALLNIYILLKEQIILGFKKISDIQDPLVKEAVLSIDSFSLSEMQSRCTPWDINSKDYLKINFKNISILPITRVIFKLLKLLKQYIHFHNDSGVNLLHILAEKMIADSVEHNGLRRFIWNSVVRVLHSSYKLVEVICILIDKSWNMSGENSYQAGIWCTELCKALLKRYKVQLLNESLISHLYTGTQSPSNNFLLNTNEFKQFKRLLMKRKLNILDKSDTKMSACIFIRVEEKNPDLKDIIRLKEAIFPENWQIFDLMELLLLRPTQFTEDCFISLNELLKRRYKQEEMKSLLELCRIIRGQDLIMRRGRRVYKASHLKQAISSLPTVSVLWSDSSESESDEEEIHKRSESSRNSNLIAAT